MARPARVVMRWRKPCLRIRLLTFGWNVLFIWNPGKSIGSAESWPGNAEKMDLKRLLRAGEKVKGRAPSRKKPFAVPGRMVPRRCSRPVEKSDSAWRYGPSGGDQRWNPRSWLRFYGPSILACCWRAISSYFPLATAVGRAPSEVFGGRSVPGFRGYPQMWMWLWKPPGRVADCGGWVGALCYAFRGMAGPVERVSEDLARICLNRKLAKVAVPARTWRRPQPGHPGCPEWLPPAMGAG